jgi:polyisoprenoid-binding protein YceI
VYAVDAERTVVYAVSHTRGLVEALSEHHVIRATQVTGTLGWDPADPKACAIDLQVAAEGLRVDDAGDRRMAGLDGVLDAADRTSVRAVLLGEGLLDAAANPHITFTSSACAVTGATATVQGTLTINDHTDEVLVPVLFDAHPSEVRVTGSLPILQSRFGIELFSRMLGAVSVDDAVRLRFTLVASPTPAG